MIERTVGVVNCVTGSGVQIVQPVNMYGARLGQDVFVGPFCEIQSDVTVGDRTRIQSHSFICSMVSIGSDCFIGHGVNFVNDRFRIGGPAKGNLDLWESTTIEDYVSIGSGSVILPVTIASGIVVGAGSVVTKNLTQRGIYAGNPAVMIRSLA